MLQKKLSNLVETKHNDLLVEAIKSRVSTHITSNYIIKHNVAREFLGTLVTTTLVFSKDASAKIVAKNLGLSRKCVYQNLQWRLQIEDGALDFWTDIKKQQRSTALSTKTRYLMIEWWIMETIVFPRRKKICKKKPWREANYRISHPFLVGIPTKNFFRTLVCSCSLLQMLPRL